MILVCVCGYVLVVSGHVPVSVVKAQRFLDKYIDNVHNASPLAFPNRDVEIEGLVASAFNCSVYDKLFRDGAVHFEGDSTVRGMQNAVWNLKHSFHNSSCLCDQGDVVNVRRQCNNHFKQLVVYPNRPVQRKGDPFEVLVYSHGLHYLHLFPTRINTILDNSTFRAQLEVFSSGAGPHGCVVFRTVNAICTEKYKGSWKKYGGLYESGKLPANDTKAMHEWCREYGTTPEVCDLFSLTNRGVDALNEIMRDFVNEKQQGNSSNTTVLLLDANRVLRDKCAYTQHGDGRHYHPLNFIEWQLYTQAVRMCKATRLNSMQARKEREAFLKKGRGGHEKASELMQQRRFEWESSHADIKELRETWTKKLKNMAEIRGGM